MKFRRAFSENGAPVSLLTVYLGLVIAGLLAAIGFSIFTAVGSENGPHRLSGILFATPTPSSPSDAEDTAATAAGQANADLARPSIEGEDGAATDALGAPIDPATRQLALSSPIAGLEFDLSANGGETLDAIEMGDGAIQIRKQLMLDNTQLGTITISIDDSERLFADREGLAGLLSQTDIDTAPLERLAPSDFVSFQRLRQYGLNLKYDPITDRIILET